jgi:chromosome segregation ATPase
MKRMEEERKGLLGEEGRLEMIIKELDNPQNGLAAAGDYLDKLLAKFQAQPAEIAEEIVKILRDDEDLESEEKNLDRYIKTQREELQKVRERSVVLKEYETLAENRDKTDAEKVAEIKKWLADKKLTSKEKADFRLSLEQWDNLHKKIAEAKKRIESIEEKRVDYFLKKVELERWHKEIMRIFEAKEALEKRIEDAKKQ